jgi:hypothetical protein
MLLLASVLVIAAVIMTTTNNNIAYAYKFDTNTYTGSVNKGDLMKALDLSNAELNALNLNTDIQFAWQTLYISLKWQCATEDGIIADRTREHISMQATVVNHAVKESAGGTFTGIELTSKANIQFGEESGDSQLHCPETFPVLVEGSVVEDRNEDGSLLVRLVGQGGWVPV